MGVKFGTSWGSPKIFSKSQYYDDFFKNGLQLVGPMLGVFYRSNFRVDFFFVLEIFLRDFFCKIHPFAEKRRDFKGIFFLLKIIFFYGFLL